MGIAWLFELAFMPANILISERLNSPSCSCKYRDRGYVTLPSAGLLIDDFPPCHLLDISSIFIMPIESIKIRSQPK